VDRSDRTSHTPLLPEDRAVRTQRAHRPLNCACSWSAVQYVAAKSTMLRTLGITLPVLAQAGSVFPSRQPAPFAFASGARRSRFDSLQGGSRVF